MDEGLKKLHGMNLNLGAPDDYSLLTQSERHGILAALNTDMGGYDGLLQVADTDQPSSLPLFKSLRMRRQSSHDK